ncbi:MAG: hypothetical protein E7648_07220 [Ruminococcaceae bacterium]|nr:hypothetical protein [Oscillospiraceae bacterium]MBO5041230.1 hypothetical protein [Clostridia bacterium]
MQTVKFDKAGWENELTTAYTFRYVENPKFTQKDGYVTTAVNKNHREGFDNISMLTHEKQTAGVTATLHCAFEDIGCPEIIIVPETEKCPDGEYRYGACFEVVLWKNGINVWRHFREEDGRCHWHLRLGDTFNVSENDIHTLTVNVEEYYLNIDVDGHKIRLRVEDIPKEFYIGLTACEGIVRIYDYTVEA